MTDETKGDVMTLEQAVACVDSHLSRMNRYYHEKVAWQVIKEHLADQSAMRVDEATSSCPDVLPVMQKALRDGINGAAGIWREGLEQCISLLTQACDRCDGKGYYYGGDGHAHRIKCGRCVDGRAALESFAHTLGEPVAAPSSDKNDLRPGYVKCLTCETQMVGYGYGEFPKYCPACQEADPHHPTTESK